MAPYHCPGRFSPLYSPYTPSPAPHYRHAAHAAVRTVEMVRGCAKTASRRVTRDWARKIIFRAYSVDARPFAPQISLFMLANSSLRAGISHLVRRAPRVYARYRQAYRHARVQRHHVFAALYRATTCQRRQYFWRLCRLLSTRSHVRSTRFRVLLFCRLHVRRATCVPWRAPSSACHLPHLPRFPSSKHDMPTAPATSLMSP